MRPLTTLAGSSAVTSPAAPASCCKFTLVWTSARLPSVAVSEGLHANMASTKATSGESASRSSKVQCYAESPVGNSASCLAAARAFVAREGGPFPSPAPWPGSVAGLLKGTGRRSPVISGGGHVTATKFCSAVGAFVEGLIHASLPLCRNATEALLPSFNLLSAHPRLLQLWRNKTQIKLPIFFCSLWGAEVLWVIQPPLLLLKLKWLKIHRKYRNGGGNNKSG